MKNVNGDNGQMDDGNTNKILSKETFVANKDWCYEWKYERE